MEGQLFKDLDNLIGRMRYLHHRTSRSECNVSAVDKGTAGHRGTLELSVMSLQVIY
jgi:hypothetical protein